LVLIMLSYLKAKVVTKRWSLLFPTKLNESSRRLLDSCFKVIQLKFLLEVYWNVLALINCTL
jgi:hypothetical protein